MLKNRKYNLTFTQISAIGFLLIILFGGFLLSLPVSSRTGEWTPFLNALFTSTSATCVTGLVVYDTFSHFTLFGQIVIISLIQIGGLGFMTVATLFSFMLRRKIGLRQRGLLQESVSTVQIGGVVRLTKHILMGTVGFEALGAILLSIRFCPKMGLARGIYNGIFHSISAFCNAGFDLMGRFEPSSSLTHFSDDIIVNVVIMSLITIGGLGFFVWEDLYHKKFKFKKYRLQTKIVLIVSGILIFGGALVFYIFEKNNTFAGMSLKETVLASLFASVTPRTAGFNTIDIPSMSSGSILFSIILMVIGGSPGSTAGGIKTTAFAVILIAFVSSFRNTEDLNVFNRRLEPEVIKRAYNVITTYFVAATVGALIVCCAEPSLEIKQVLFEIASALSTVGMTTGITSGLGSLSKIVIMILMYMGRIGSLSVALAFAKRIKNTAIRYPIEKISI